MFRDGSCASAMRSADLRSLGLMPLRISGPVARKQRAAPSEAAVHHQALAADIVAVGAAEQVHRARRFTGIAAAAERNHLVHGGDTAALHADLDLAALHLDLARL